MRVFERVGQILLPHPVAGEGVRVLVALLALKARAVGVDVLHLARDVAALPGAHVGAGRVDRGDDAVGFRRGGQQNARLRERELRLRQAELQGVIHARLYDAHRLRVRHADDLARRAEDAAARAGQIPGFEQPRKIMQRRVRIGAAQRFHQRGDNVVMLVPLAVIAHGAALRHGAGVVRREHDLSVDARRGGEQKLHGVERLAHVAAAALRHERHDLVRAVGLNALAPGKQPHGAAHRAFRVARRDRLELKHRAAREDGVVYIEVRVFRRGRDERDRAVLDEFEQALLLLFIEVLDLVEIQKNAVRREHGVQLVDDRADVRKARGRGVELSQRAVRLFRNDARDGRFARTGRAVKDHVRDIAAFDDAAQQPALAENVALADDVVQLRRTQLIRQRAVFFLRQSERLL